MSERAVIIYGRELAEKVRGLCGRIWEGDPGAIQAGKRLTAAALKAATGKGSADPRTMMAAKLLAEALQGGHAPRSSYISSVSGESDPETVGAARQIAYSVGAGRRPRRYARISAIALLKRLRAYRMAYGSRPRR